jgi:hypothetical protein
MIDIPRIFAHRRKPRRNNGWLFSNHIETSPTANPVVFDFNSTVDQETIAANGDKVFFSFSGQVTLIPLDATFTTFSAVWSGEFVVQGGTGRFANAKPAVDPL